MRTNYQSLDDYENLIKTVINRDFKQSTTLSPMQVKLKKEKDKFQLKQVVRDLNSPDSGVQEQIFSIHEDKGDKAITCLSKFKYYKNESQTFNPKLVVCVCAYNQDKQMLQETLKGIYDSLKNFEQNSGIKSQQIVVLVIFDGIRNIKRGDYQEDMITFFDEVDYINGSILKQGEQSFETLLKNGKRAEEINWKNTSSLRQSQIQSNIQRRFRARYEDFMNLTSIKKECQNKNRTYQVQKLIPRVKDKYDQLRKNYIQKKAQEEISNYKEVLKRLHQKKFSPEELKNKRKQIASGLQEQYKKRAVQLQNRLKHSKQNHSKIFDGTYNIRYSYVQKAYRQILKLCNKYFQSREQTCLIYPTQFRPNPTYDSLESETSQEPKLNVLLCVKHKNAGKLSSHALFFLGFCQFMKPQICLLMDVGLQPLDDAIYKMFEYMDKNANTGGVCGYMGLKVQKVGDQFGVQNDMNHLDGLSYLFHQQIFSVQKAQLFEYHMGHLIDKPFQSAFNFIHVLPGAFSCYRYSALAQGSNLDHYLQPALQPNKARTLEQQNMFLAEDRTLSLVLKQNNKDFAYLPTAKAVVDPASSLVVLMGQRRRWINGSWFAFFYVFSKRQSIRDICTRLQFLYYYCIHGLTYVSISLFYVSLFLTVQALIGQIVQNMGFIKGSQAYLKNQNIPTCVICFLYIIINGGLVFLSLQVKNNDKRFQRIYYFASTFLGIYGLIVTSLMLYNILILITEGGWNAAIFNNDSVIIPNSVTRAFMIGTIGIYGFHVLCSFSFRIMLQMLGATIHYIFYAPTYLHLLMIYAFCKIDDFSWGTKGLQGGSSEAGNLKKLQTQNKTKKFLHVFKFMGINVLIGVCLVIVISYPQSKNVFITIFSGLFFTITVFKFIISLGYLLKYYCINFSMGYSSQQKRINLQRYKIIQDTLNKRIEAIRQESRKNIIEQIQNTFNVTASTIKRRKKK